MTRAQFLYCMDSTSLQVLFPDVLASAIWQQAGRAAFEKIFFGPSGRTGAKKFWDHVKAYCPWYPKNVQQSEHDGLVPLSLYGDDVQAYRMHGCC